MSITEPELAIVKEVSLDMALVIEGRESHGQVVARVLAGSDIINVSFTEMDGRKIHLAFDPETWKVVKNAIDSAHFFAQRAATEHTPVRVWSRSSEYRVGQDPNV